MIYDLIIIGSGPAGVAALEAADLEDLVGVQEAAERIDDRRLNLLGVGADDVASCDWVSGGERRNGR